MHYGELVEQNRDDETDWHDGAPWTHSCSPHQWEWRLFDQEINPGHKYDKLLETLEYD